MSLINYEPQPIRLSSGKTSHLKIDADFLSDRDIEGLAAVAFRIIPSFSAVESIPRGGDRLAAAMEKFVTLMEGRQRILIVDDVLTTGASFEKAKGDRYTVQGLVIFDRSPGLAPWWVTALFRMPLAEWI